MWGDDMYSDLGHVEPYDDSAESRYEEFITRRIRWHARKPLIIALTALVIIFAVYVGRDSFFKAYTNEQLFDMYFECYDINSDKSFNYMQAIQSYKDRDFKQAITLFTEISQKDSLSISNIFYLAISYAKCDRYNEAIDLFKQVSFKQNNVYRNSSNWYLGLCYLKIHSDEKAREQFELLIKGENEYKADALRILKQMKY